MKSNGLELYAKIEDMLDFSEAIEILYSSFYTKIHKIKPKTIIDIGCGSGAFGMGLVKGGYDVFGIDVSEKMVENSKKLGLKAEHINLCDVKEKFDTATAVFDVLNYMNKDELTSFFGCVKNVLNQDGYFLADVNTFYGFDEIAQGTIAIEDENRYVVIEAEFDEPRLITNIKLFSKQIDNLFAKEEGEIVQYYHDKKTIEKISGMKIVDIVEIGLYGKKPDKYLYVFKNS